MNPTGTATIRTLAAMRRLVVTVCGDLPFSHNQTIPPAICEIPAPNNITEAIIMTVDISDEFADKPFEKAPTAANGNANPNTITLQTTSFNVASEIAAQP